MNRLFITVLNMSITGAVVIIAVILARLLLKNTPKKYSYMLWLLVAFRFICPFSFRSVFSVFNLNFLNVSARKNTALPAMNFVPESFEPYKPEYEYIYHHGVGGYTSYETKTEYNTEEIVLFILCLVWLIGVAVFIAYGFISYYNTKTRVCDEVHIKDNIYTSKYINSPFVFGFIKPKIYIPENMDDSVLNYVIEHENYHIKRKDHIIKLISYLILCVHWFNPLCYIAFILMTKDMEMSCDEQVLKKSEGIKREYSLTLLSFASGKKISFVSPLAFGETSVKSRIKNVLNYKKPITITIVSAFLIIIAVSVVLASNPATQKLKELVPIVSLENYYDSTWVVGVNYNTHLVWQERYERFIDELEDIEISLNPISSDLSDYRPHENSVTAVKSTSSGFQSYINIYFSHDFTELWVNENYLNKETVNSYSYKVLNPEKVKSLFESTNEEYRHNYLNVSKLEKYFNVTKKEKETVEICIDKKHLPKLSEIPIQEENKPLTRYPLENGGVLVYDSETADIYLTYIMRRYGADINMLQLEFKTVYNIQGNPCSIPLFYDYECLYGIYYANSKGQELTAADNFLYDSKGSIENGIENVGVRGTVEFIGVGITAHLDAYMNAETYENTDDYLKFYIDIPILELEPK